MNIHELIRIFLPVFFFHTNEVYFPSSMEYAFENCQLYNGNTLIADYGNVKPDMIQNNMGHRIRINQKIHYGEFNNKKHEDIPIYVSVKNPPDLDYYEIIYVVYFPFSGPYSIFGKKVGDHDSDLEHIAVRVSKEHGSLIGIYYSYHSEGIWCHPEEIEFLEGRPVVYVARGSHGFYPYEGTHHRIFGFANDKMNQGTLWRPSKVIRVDTDKTDVVPPYWMYYRGQLSMQGIDNLPLKGWYRNLEPDESSTTFRDCFFPCWYPKCFLCTVPFIPSIVR